MGNGKHLPGPLPFVLQFTFQPSSPCRTLSLRPLLVPALPYPLFKYCPFYTATPFTPLYSSLAPPFLISTPFLLPSLTHSFQFYPSYILTPFTPLYSSLAPHFRISTHSIHSLVPVLPYPILSPAPSIYPLRLLLILLFLIYSLQCPTHPHNHSLQPLPCPCPPL